MKFVKTVKVEIEITEELIDGVNEIYADPWDEDNKDFHNLNSLEKLLDETVRVSPYGDFGEMPEVIYELTTCEENTKIVES
jgi:hypothetical protein